MFKSRCAAATLFLVGIAPLLTGGVPSQDLVTTDLDKPIDLGQRVEGVPMQSVFEFISDKTGVKISVDDLAFIKAGREGNIEQRQVNLPRLKGSSASVAVEIVATQVESAVDERAFRRAGEAEGIAEAEIALDLVGGKTAEEALKAALDQVKATYRIAGNVVVIVPKEPKNG